MKLQIAFLILNTILSFFVGRKLGKLCLEWKKIREARREIVAVRLMMVAAEVSNVFMSAAGEVIGKWEKQDEEWPEQIGD